MILFLKDTLHCVHEGVYTKHQRWCMSQECKCYKLDQQNIRHLLFECIYKTPTCFALHCSTIRVQMYETVARPYYHLKYTEMY